MGERTNAATRTVVVAVTSTALSVSLGGLVLVDSASAAAVPLVVTTATGR